MIGKTIELFSKNFKLIAVIGYLILIGTLVFFQYQKDNLRQDITNITAKKESIKTSYEAELERINTKHNQIIKDMIDQEKYERIKKELEQERKQKEIETRKNKELRDKLDIVKGEEGQCLDQELPVSLQDLL